MSLRTAPPVALSAGSAAQEAEHNGQPPAFEGFDPPESNFWRLPNAWFDIVAAFTSWAEHKVVEYILRHTWGYQEYGICKHITMDEFMHGRKRRDGSRIDAGCGMAENSIKKGIADAVSHGFLVVEIDDSDRGRIKKYYGPRMRRLPSDEGGAAVRPLPPNGEGAQRTSAVGTASIPYQGQRQGQQGQTPILGGQGLTPEGQEMPPAPRSLTPPDQPAIPQGQHTGGRLPRSAPRTEQQRSAIHLVKDTSSKQSAAHQPVKTPSAPGVSSAEHTVDTGALARKLMAEGIAEAKAWSLVQRYPAERIARQVRWLDERRYQNRAATLVAAIERDYEPPAGRRGAETETAVDRSKYYRGAFALCPRCGSRPCLCSQTSSMQP